MESNPKSCNFAADMQLWVMLDMPMGAIPK